MLHHKFVQEKDCRCNQVAGVTRRKSYLIHYRVSKWEGYLSSNSTSHDPVAGTEATRVR